MIKKLTLTFPFVLLFLHMMFESAGVNWTQVLSSSGQIHAIANNPASPNIIYAGSNSTGVWKSTNGGTNWVQVNAGLDNLTVQAMGLCNGTPNTLYAGTSSAGSSPGVYKTTNGGTAWVFASTGITQTPLAVQALAVHPTNPNICIIGVWDPAGGEATDGVFRTTNGGTSWSASSTGFGTNKNVLAIAFDPINPNVVYAGTSFFTGSMEGPTYIYKSTDGGATWTNSSNGLPTTTTAINPVRALSVSNTNSNIVLAGLFINSGEPENGGAWLSTNAGGLWTRIHTAPLPQAPGQLIRACRIRPGTSSEFYLGINSTDSGGVYRSTNTGQTWISFNGGALTSTVSIRSLGSTNLDLYAGAHSAGNEGVYENEEPIGIIGQSGNIPGKFALSQNFPNPFNPATYIQYDIPKESYVILKVYDISGREIQTLVSETKYPGSYQVLFDATSLTSGIYLYTLTAGDFSDSKKMILVK